MVAHLDVDLEEPGVTRNAHVRQAHYDGTDAQGRGPIEPHDLSNSIEHDLLDTSAHTSASIPH